MSEHYRFSYEGKIPDELEVEAVWWTEEGIVEGIVSSEKREGLLSIIPEAVLSPLEERDWLKEDEQRLPSLEVGPFFIHGPHYVGNKKGWEIESAHAFGSGHHPTTRRCLETLLKLAEHQKVSMGLDLGCGSGILAMGIAHLWPAVVFASDCEIESVESSRRNFQKNGFPEIQVYKSFGMQHPELQKNAPYDLIVANIHSGPLSEMAEEVLQSLAPEGTLLLSGILIEQEEGVRDTYAPLKHIGSFYDDRWTTLLLKK